MSVVLNNKGNCGCHQTPSDKISLVESESALTHQVGMDLPEGWRENEWWWAEAPVEGVAGFRKKERYRVVFKHERS